MICICKAFLMTMAPKEDQMVSVPLKKEGIRSIPYLLSGLAHIALIWFLYQPHAHRVSEAPLGTWVEMVTGDLQAPSRKTVAPKVQAPPEESLVDDSEGQKAAAASAPQGVLGNTNASVGDTGPMGEANGVVTTIRSRYLFELEAFLNQYKTYPARARHLGQEGRVEVAFHLHADGSISDPHVVHPCEHDILNEAAIKLVSNIGRFRPIPPELNLPIWHITVPIQYELN
jgi:TonB family protein